MMKKIALILIIFSLTAGFAACKSEPPGTDGNETLDPAAPEKTVTLSASELAAAIAETFEMAMLEHTEQSDIELFLPGADFADVDEIAFWQQAMTVHLIEIIVIKPAEGKADAVVAFLNERRQTLKDQLAFYPSQITAAEAAVVGSIYNVAYLICHEDAQTAENKLLELIEESM